MIPTQKQITEWQEMERDLNRMARRLKCKIFEVATKIDGIMARINELENEDARLRGRITEGRK